MCWEENRYDIEVFRSLDGVLATISAAELEQAEDEGYLAGNGMYFAIGDVTFDTLRAALDREKALIGRLGQTRTASGGDQQIPGVAQAGDWIWDLDLGVVSTVLAVAALGAIPVSSCNAGGFGGAHAAAHPYVAFYMVPEQGATFLDAAERSGIGLCVREDGLVLAYSDRDLGLLGFAGVVASR